MEKMFSELPFPPFLSRKPVSSRFDGEAAFTLHEHFPMDVGGGGKRFAARDAIDLLFVFPEGHGGTLLRFSAEGRV